MASKRTDDPRHWPLHIGLVLMLVVTIYPILWVFTIAFSGGQSLAFVDLPADPSFFDRLRTLIPWPDKVSLENFTSVWNDQPFGRWLLNSVIVSAGTTIVGVAFACSAAYAFSRFRFPGRRTGLMAFLVSQMFPGTLMLIPIYIILVLGVLPVITPLLGQIGSAWVSLMLVYSVTAIPFCVWMLKGYFDTIPRELEEAALIDGASQATIFFRVILPLAKPAVAVTALFSFMTAWNEFIIAATIMDAEAMYTGPVGLRFFVGGYSQQWGYFAAGAIIVAIPVVLLFMYLQRYLVSGLTAGAVKG